MKKKKASGGKSPKPMGAGTGGNEYIVLPPADEISLYHRLFEDVRAFLIERYPDPVQAAFDVFADVNQLENAELEEEDPDDPLMVQFTDWLIHTPGLIQPDRTGIDLYLEKSARLDELERGVLRRMNDSLVTLCEMQLGGSHDRVVFKDLLLDNEFEIQVDENMPAFPEGLLVAVRVIPFTAGPALGLGSYPFITDKELLLEMIQEFLEDYRKDAPESTLENFLRMESPLLILWFEYMREMGREEEESESGEASETDMFLAHFEVSDPREVRKRLRTIRGLEEWQKDTFDWMGELGEDGENQFRGEVTLANGKLVLSAVSEELREAGKIMLLSTCRGLIRHTLDSVEKSETDED